MRKKTRVLVPVLRRYPDLYPADIDLDPLFFWAYKLVHTRSFAWGKPEGMLVPFADNLNHADINLTYKTLEKAKVSERESQPMQPGTGKLYMNRMMKYIHKYQSVEGLREIRYIWETEEALKEFESSSEENSDSEDSSSDSNDSSGSDSPNEDCISSLSSYPSKSHESLYYFSIYTGEDCSFSQGQQVFNCYGRHSNATLLLYYGFAMFDNHHDSLQFKASANVAVEPGLRGDYYSAYVDIGEGKEGETGRGECGGAGHCV